jgi:transcriptional regulator with XRE-family HTH domain
MSKRLSKLIAELEEWCDAKRGRRLELADRLGVSRQAIHAWLAGTSIPSGEQVLEIQEILKTHKPPPKAGTKA